MIINSKSEKDTATLADYLAKKILGSGDRRSAVVVSLVGELGAGKTAFTKAFMKGLGIKDTITSPTFNIMKIYEIPQVTTDRKQMTTDKKFRSAYHIDAYRIKSTDLLKLGFKEIIKDAANIVLIEWADIVKDILPKEAINIEIEHADKEGERKIKLS